MKSLNLKVPNCQVRSLTPSFDIVGCAVQRVGTYSDWLSKREQWTWLRYSLNASMSSERWDGLGRDSTLLPGISFCLQLQPWPRWTCWHRNFHRHCPNEYVFFSPKLRAHEILSYSTSKNAFGLFFTPVLANFEFAQNSQNAAWCS